MDNQQSLPILVPPIPQQRWSCQNCGRCCRDLVAHLTREDRQRIDDQAWTQILDAPPYVRLGRQWVLNQIPGKGCVFLLDDGKCAIHAEFGFDSKPVACRIFPFVLKPLEGALILSFRFDCPALIQSQGQSVGEHVSYLKRLIPELPDLSLFEDEIFFPGQRTASSLEVHSLVLACNRWLSNSNLSFSVRLFGLASIVETLSGVNLQKVRDRRFVELVDMLFDELRERSFEESWPEPTAKQSRLFRQQVFAHTEYAFFSDVIGGLRTKVPRMWSQFLRSRQFGRLEGTAPATSITDQEIPFPDIEAVGPSIQDAAQIQELAVRYLRAQVLCRSCFGPHYYGWNILLGLRSLLARMAVWGFLARYCVAAEGKTEIDLDSAVSALNTIARTAGLSKALGSRAERLRLTYLQLDHGIERLLAAFPLI